MAAASTEHKQLFQFVSSTALLPTCLRGRAFGHLVRLQKADKKAADRRRQLTQSAPPQGITHHSPMVSDLSPSVPCPFASFPFPSKRGSSAAAASTSKPPPPQSRTEEEKFAAAAFRMPFPTALPSIRGFFTLVGLLLLLVDHAPRVQCRIAPKPNGHWNRLYGNPGIKLRLTRKGAEYMKNIAVKLINEQLATLRGFRAQHSIDQPGISGTIYVNDVQTLAYRPPAYSNLQFVAPHFMNFGIQEAAITLSGRFLGDMGPFLQFPGTVYGQLQGLSIQLMAQFRASPDGLIAVSVAQCQTQLRYSQFTINPEGLFGPILKIFELTINDLIRQRIPDLLCRSLQDIVERNSPQLFQRLTNIPLSEHFSTFGNGSDGVIERFIRRFTDGLYIDGRMVADPVVTSDFFETQQRGELRYGQTAEALPFFPAPIPVERDSDRMLYLYASDYTLNSMLYHAYQLDRLTIRVEQQTLPPLYRTFVQTTCPEIDQVGGDFLKSICVGKLIPAIAKHFPNTTTKFVMLPHELPEMHFLPGLSTMDLRARILTFVHDKATRRDRQILVSSADGVADIKLNAAEGKFSGDLKLKKLLIRLHRSAIPIEPESISQLAPLAKTFLGPELAKGLKQGLPFPLKESVRFIGPQLGLHEGYVRLATDFELNEGHLRQKVAEAFERIKAESAGG